MAVSSAMAQQPGQVDRMLLGPPGIASGPGLAARSASLTAEELHEVEQCENLIRFRDEVLSGSHPRIKPPHRVAAAKPGGGSYNSPRLPSSLRHSSPSTSTSVSASTAPASSAPAPAAPAAPPTGTAKASATMSPLPLNRVSASNTAATSNGTEAGRRMENMGSFSANANLPGLGMLQNHHESIPSSTVRVTKPSGSGKIEINPILLEKSDELIKAEIQIQRQRVERALRDQIEQRRISAKASLQSSESLIDVDLNEIFTRAMALVQGTAQPIDEIAADDVAANASASSDSFDDNTFYSSQHDSPESPQLARIPDDIEEDQRKEGSPYEPSLHTDSLSVPLGSPVAAAREDSASKGYSVQALPPQQPSVNVMPQIETRPFPNPDQQSSAASMLPGLSGAETDRSKSAVPPNQMSRIDSTQDSGENSGSGDSIYARSTDQSRLERVNDQLVEEEAWERLESVVLRAHNLSPIAPQPEHVHHLATARQAPAAPVDGLRQGTPAQVAALRKQPSDTSSPDSSPHTNKATRNGRKKRNKKSLESRLAGLERQLAGRPASPYIKPEPRSPSPITAPAYTRPNKRQKQSQHPVRESDSDEPRYQQPPRAGDGYREGYSPRLYRDEGPSAGYRPDDPYRGTQSIDGAPSTRRYEADYRQDERSPGTALYRRPQSPASYLYEHPPEEVRGARPVSRPVVDQPYRDRPPYYPEIREAPRTSGHYGPERSRSRSPVIYERHAPAMGPPRPPPTRIVVDEFGREYIEPPRASTAIRQSVGPATRPSEPEVIYERTRPSTAHRRADAMEEDRVVYRRTSPVTSPRYPAERLLSRSELSPQYRSYRERDYPGPRLLPGDDFVQIRGPGVERQSLGESPREYIARAVSVRPAGESARYEAVREFERRPVDQPSREYISAPAAPARLPDTIRYEISALPERRFVDDLPPRQYTRASTALPMDSVRYERPPDDYGTRMQSARPEAVLVREYSSSVRPGNRREVGYPPPPPPRAFSMAPPEPSYTYEEPYRFERQVYETTRGRGDEEVVYLDQRPRGGYR